MTEYTLSSKDLVDAENFLVEFQSEMVPEANLEKGGAVRDLLIKGFACMYAYLRGEIDNVSARQSLLKIQDSLTDEDDIADAVDEILSNWFIFRKSGTKATMTARLHFTEKRAQVIDAATVFWRTNNARFVLDTSEVNYVITESQLFPVFDTNGDLLDYIVEVPLVSVNAGTGYNLEPGTFVQVEAPGGLPYFSYAENTESSSGGTNTETTEDMISRAETAISVRNLINNRSCDVTLQEQFPAITETLTIGMGEPEQIRDRRMEVGRHLRLHTGGCYDTYVSLPPTTIEENHTVGGYFVRPDNLIVAFRDPELTYDLGRTFTSLGVQVGHILYLRAGLPGLPRAFQITSVSDHELSVSDATPFPSASDETTTNEVRYSIGWLSPAYAEIELEAGVYDRIAAPSTDPATSSVPYGTSRRVQAPGTVVLSGKPVQDILWVELTDPPASLSPLIDPSTGTIIFQVRTNTEPVATTDPASLQYQVVVDNPEKAQSMSAVNKIYLGGITTPPASDFDTYNLRVSYTSLSGFNSVDAYAVNRNNRVTGANHLIRARHPVLITMNIPYRLKATATGTVDHEEAAIAVASHINAFDPNDDLDVSDISSFLRQTYPDIGAVYPLTAVYTLSAPDGQQISFTTTDIISVFGTSSNGVAIENAGEITPPQDLLDRGIGPSLASTVSTIDPTVTLTEEANVLDWLTYLGVSDRTVHYMTVDSMITFELRS